MNENPCTNPVRERQFVKDGDDLQRLSEERSLKIKGFANLASSGIAFAVLLVASPHFDVVETRSAGTMLLIAEMVLSMEA